MKNSQEKFQQYLDFEVSDEENIETHEKEILENHQLSGRISLGEALQKHHRKRRRRQQALGALCVLLFPISIFFVQPHFSEYFSETETDIIYKSPEKSTEISDLEILEFEQIKNLIQEMKSENTADIFAQELQKIEQQIANKNYESALRQLKKLSHQPMVQQQADLRQHITDLHQVLVKLYQDSQ